MRHVAVHRRSLASLASLWVCSSLFAAAPLVPSTARAHAPEADTGDFDALLSQAEERRNAGAHAESARLYAAAYRALPEDERADLMGEITANNAVADYRVARKAAPDDDDLLAEHAALLEQVVADRERAHAAGKAEAVPPELLLERGELRAALEQKKAEEDAAAAQEDEDAEPEPIEPAPPPPEEDASPPGRGASIAILSAGIVSIAGGGALLGLGASNLGQLDRIVGEQEAALAAADEYTEEQRLLYALALQDWEQQGRNLSLGLLVGGGALAAAGIGLTTWGAIRLARGRKAEGDQARIGSPRLTVRPRGLTLAFDF